MFNVAQAQAVYSINNSSNQISDLLYKIETGKRINYAADDSSGMTIATNLRSQHTGLDQSIRNANDAIGLTTIADSALKEYAEILQEAREKATEAASDTNSTESRLALENDVKALFESAEVIAKQTSYNGIALLDGTFTGKKFQTGAYASQTTDITITDASIATLGVDDASIDLTSTAGATTAMTDIDAAIDALNVIRSNIGATTKGLESRVKNMTNTSTQIKEAESQIMDIDEATTKAEIDK